MYTLDEETDHKDISGNIIINKDEDNIAIVEEDEFEDVPCTNSHSNNVSSTLNHNIVPTQQDCEAKKSTRFSMMFKNENESN